MTGMELSDDGFDARDVWQTVSNAFKVSKGKSEHLARTQEKEQLKFILVNQDVADSKAICSEYTKDENECCKFTMFWISFFFFFNDYDNCFKVKSEVSTQDDVLKNESDLFWTWRNVIDYGCKNFGVAETYETTFHG